MGILEVARRSLRLSGRRLWPTQSGLGATNHSLRLTGRRLWPTQSGHAADPSHNLIFMLVLSLLETHNHIRLKATSWCLRNLFKHLIIGLLNAQHEEPKTSFGWQPTKAISTI